MREVKNRSSGISKSYHYGINIYLHLITIRLSYHKIISPAKHKFHIKKDTILYIILCETNM